MELFEILNWFICMRAVHSLQFEFYLLFNSSLAGVSQNVAKENPVQTSDLFILCLDEN